MTSPNPRDEAVDAVAAAFKRMHSDTCYPSASDGEAKWAAEEIIKAYRAAVDRVNRATDAEIGGIHRSFAPAPAIGVDAVREALLEAREYAPRRDGIVARIDAALAALSPSTSAAEPVAPMHGPYRVKWLGAGVWAGINEELPAELEGKDVWLTTTPPAPAAVDGQRVKALEWSEHAPPNGKDCFYDHVGAETPFGKYNIEWKSWESHDWPTVDFRGEFLRACPTLDEAKAAAQADYEARIRACLATDKEGA